MTDNVEFAEFGRMDFQVSFVLFIAVYALILLDVAFC
jgi:hypothetical protein